MPSIQPRVNSNGTITSYKITVSAGFDYAGNRIRRTSIWTPTRYGMTPKQMEKEATAAAYKFEEQIKQGYIMDQTQKFADYAQYVLQVKENAGVRASTIDRYVELLVRINEKIGHLAIGKIRAQHLNEFYDYLKKEAYRANSEKAFAKRSFKTTLYELGLSKAEVARRAGIAASTLTVAVKGDAISAEKARVIADALEEDPDDLFRFENIKTPLSEKTILEHHRLISTIFAQAEKEMLIPYNPAAKASPPKPKKSKPDYYQPDEMDEILLALESVPIRWKAITYLLIDTGCRRGEILGLKPENIDFENKIVVIDHALIATKSKGVYEEDTKTGQMRALSLSPQSIDALKEWLAERSRWKLAQGDRWEESGYVFTQENGRRVHPDTITDWLADFSEKNNLPHIHPHAFRHTAASTMIANGVDIVTTANELGHADANTTAKIYAHQISVAKAKAANVRAGVFSGRPSKPKKKAV